MFEKISVQRPCIRAADAALRNSQIEYLLSQPGPGRYKDSKHILPGRLTASEVVDLKMGLTPDNPTVNKFLKA